VAHHQLIQHAQRVVRLSADLVRARELIQHGVAPAVVRIGFEEPLEKHDCILEARLSRGCPGIEPARLGRLELQVREPPHRLGTQTRIRGDELQKRPVAVPGLLAAVCNRRARRELHRPALQARDRAVLRSTGRK
jgi:hypothetical protein